jgi:hypothetical protein
MAKAKQRDLSERQFLKAVERHGMNLGGSASFIGGKGWFNLGIPGRNIWDKFPDTGQKLNRRAKLAYMLASRERAIARVEAERAAYAKVDPELISRSLPHGEDR